MLPPPTGPCTWPRRRSTGFSGSTRRERSPCSPGPVFEGDNGDGGPATKANLVPAGIAADDAGNAYISVQYGHKIRRVDAGGTITTFAGRGTSAFVGGLGDGGPATQAGFGYPTDLTFHDGSLYIVDEGTRPRIRRIDPAGIITTVVAGP